MHLYIFSAFRYIALTAIVKVRDSIVFSIPMFNCFITLLQHVRGHSALCCQINVCIYVQCESKKGCHYSLVHNCAKFWPIFTILSLLDSALNL